MPNIHFEELLTPETILPVQFQHIWSESRDVTPERALLIAMLWQAVNDLQTQRDGRTARRRRLYREAYQWVDSEDRDWPFSFLNICDRLRLSAAALRGALLSPDAMAA